MFSREAILVNLATSLQFLLGEEVTSPCHYLILLVFFSFSFLVSMGGSMTMDLEGSFHHVIMVHMTKCSFGKVVARMSGQDGLLLSEEQLWAAFRDAHKCFQVRIFQIFQ